MATSPKNLSHAFKGADPDDHRLWRFLMVGAVHDKHNVMSDIDLGLFRHALRIFDLWDLPVSADLASARDKYTPPSPYSARIINILPEQGGEDFLKSEEKGDVLVLCNIAKDVPPEAVVARNNMAYLTLNPSLRASFSSSPDHEKIQCWRDQIERTGAKIVYLTNTDGFELSELNNGNFVQVALPLDGLDNKNVGMLIRRDYLAAVENYLMVLACESQSSPLLEVADAAQGNEAARFSYRLQSGQIRQFDGPA